jgi:protein-L-isoaspartate O-methyltransferase
LLQQLANGGTMVIPVGDVSEKQYLFTVTKTDKGKIKRNRKYPVRFVPMTGDQID